MSCRFFGIRVQNKYETVQKLLILNIQRCSEKDFTSVIIIYGIL